MKKKFKKKSIIEIYKTKNFSVSAIVAIFPDKTVNFSSLIISEPACGKNSLFNTLLCNNKGWDFNAKKKKLNC